MQNFLKDAQVVMQNHKTILNKFYTLETLYNNCKDKLLVVKKEKFSEQRLQEVKRLSESNLLDFIDIVSIHFFVVFFFFYKKKK